MLLNIAQLGQPVLRNPAQPVIEDAIRSAAFQQWLRDMHETLLDAPGVGLAAPQVFVAQRVFLGAVLPPPSGDEFPTVETFINPRITEVSVEKASAWEGCLSFPELMVLVPRHRAVRIEFLNVQAQPRSLVLQDFQARVVQHELDHLDGILTLDRAASTRDIVKASEIDTVLAERKKKS